MSARTTTLPRGAARAAKRSKHLRCPWCGGVQARAPGHVYGTVERDCDRCGRRFAYGCEVRYSATRRPAVRKNHFSDVFDDAAEEMARLTPEHQAALRHDVNRPIDVERR